MSSATAERRRRRTPPRALRASPGRRCPPPAPRRHSHSPSSFAVLRLAPAQRVSRSGGDQGRRPAHARACVLLQDDRIIMLYMGVVSTAASGLACLVPSQRWAAPRTPLLWSLLVVGVGERATARAHSPCPALHPTARMGVGVAWGASVAVSPSEAPHPCRVRRNAVCDMIICLQEMAPPDVKLNTQGRLFPVTGRLVRATHRRNARRLPCPCALLLPQAWPGWATRCAPPMHPAPHDPHWAPTPTPPHNPVPWRTSLPSHAPQQPHARSRPSSAARRRPPLPAFQTLSPRSLPCFFPLRSASRWDCATRPAP